MLALERRVNGRVAVDFGEGDRSVRLWVNVVEIRGDRVKLSFDAPRSVRIAREELLEEPVADGQR